jgi:hypothetical protein
MYMSIYVMSIIHDDVAYALKREGNGAAVICYFGDGAASEVIPSMHPSHQHRTFIYSFQLTR